MDTINVLRLIEMPYACQIILLDNFTQLYWQFFGFLETRGDKRFLKKQNKYISNNYSATCCFKLFENNRGFEPKIAEIGMLLQSYGGQNWHIRELGIIIGVITPWYIAQWSQVNKKYIVF